MFKGSEGGSLAPVCADVNTAPASTAFIQVFGCAHWQKLARVKPAVPGTRFMQALKLAGGRRTGLHEASNARYQVHAANFSGDLIPLTTVFLVTTVM